MKKFTKLGLVGLVLIALLAGCRQSNRVSHNLSREADEFKIVRKITVINAIQGDILYQITGLMSIEADSEKNQLVVLVKDGENSYKKQFIGLSDNVTYIVEDIDSSDVSSTKYTLLFNPEMTVPIEVQLTD